MTLLIQICARLFPKYCFWTFLGQIYGRGQVFTDFAIAKKKYNIWIAFHLHQFASEIANLASDCSMSAFFIFLCHRSHFQHFITPIQTFFLRMRKWIYRSSSMFTDLVEKAVTAEPDWNDVRSKTQKIVFTCSYINRRRGGRRNLQSV